MVAKKTVKDDIMTFEETMAKLEEAAQKLRTEELTLEESLELYNKSIMYYEFCSDYLESARQKIEIYRPESGKVDDFEEG